jgi:uncharacterized protein (TIGR02301 family)
MRSALLLALALLAAPAAAQERSPEMRGALASLTRVLGESHALRQLCEGREDQYWRGRMTRLMETEQPDPELETRLKDGFNAGFAEAKRLYPSCGDGARRAQAMSAVRGREIAGRLAHAQYRVNMIPPPLMPEQQDATGEFPPN